MKTSERHRLKENELSHVLGEAAARLSQERRKFTALALASVLVIVAVGGFLIYRNAREKRAQVMLSEALAMAQSPIEEPKPGDKPEQPGPRSYPTIRARAEAALAKFNEVHAAYPSTNAGMAARYHSGAALALLDRPAEAVTSYQDVVDRAGTDTFYGRMARLGLLTAGVQAKQFDRAIAAGQALAAEAADVIPREAVLVELARAYVAAGKKAEAKQALDEVIAKFPDSAYAEEARQLLGGLA